jgi:hypothetical protein
MLYLILYLIGFAVALGLLKTLLPKKVSAMELERQEELVSAYRQERHRMSEGTLGRYRKALRKFLSEEDIDAL